MADNSSILDYIKVPIVPMKGIREISSWEDKINDKFGPLYGYKADLDESSVRDVLYNIITTQFKSKSDGEIFTNFSNISSLYIAYLQGLKPDSLEDNQSVIDSLNEEIDKLQSSTKDCCDIFIKYGIIDIFEIAIPYNKVTQDYSIIMGEDVYVPSTQKSLFNKNREEIELNIDYNPSLSGTIFSDLNLTLKVYIFSKMKAKLFDITKFLTYVNTSVTENGGNFELRMSFVSENDITENNSYTNENINETGYVKALFLQSLIRENDLVFIKFETLKLEEKSKKNNGDVSGKIWDLIGLVDTNEIRSDASNIDITVTGRDLIKLLIEDNNFFIPYQFANSQKTAFGGSSSKIFKRLFATGKYQLQFVYSLRSIESTLGFIFSQLTNIQVLSDECYQWLSNEYGDKLGKEFTYNQEGKIETQQKIKGIWGIVNFSVDEKITHYRICDASINSPDGSILNQIDRLCQKPFVEFFGDTFGDKYTLVARRPPWDEEGIANSVMIGIDPTLAISDNLSMDTEVYSIFQYSPQGALLGGNSSLPLSYIPMIILDEYVKIWGNKLYSGVSNYIDYNTYSKTLSSGEKSPKYTFIEDLIWLIKTTAYKPFTRKGTITIRGDRRIKRGSWIWYKKTNEIFYVDSVGNMAQIQESGVERVTTLNVSRGMIRDYIKSTTSASISSSSENAGFHEMVKDTKTGAVYKNRTYNPSYFNLVAIDYLRESLINNLIEVDNQYTLERFVGNTQTVQFEGTESVVVKGVFDFFLKGKQFVKANDFNKSSDEDGAKQPAKRGNEILNENHSRAYLKRNRNI